MHNMFYRPESAFVGDVIPYCSEGQYFLYYLHDPRKREGRFAEDTTWHLITTKDFANFENRGVALKPGGPGEVNRNIYTGSVVKDRFGIYHAFYTGYNENNCINGKPVQVIMQATSTDLFHWETLKDFVLCADGIEYEEYDWRDPFVIWNAEAECYYLLVTTRLKSASFRRDGCLGLCVSKDLLRWEYRPPFYSPNMYITMECSDLFEMNGWWYLVFSTFSDRFVTHYRMATSIDGPWTIPENDTFDSRGNYAIKTASDGNKRFCFGWVPTKQGSNDFGQWEWGGDLAVHEVKQDGASGLLTVSMPDTRRAAYIDVKRPQLLKTNHCSTMKEENGLIIHADAFGGAVYETELERCLIDVKLCMEEQAESFGIAIRTDDHFDNGYFLKFEPKHNRVVLDMWPRSPFGKYQWQIHGDCPFLLELERYLKIRPRQEIAVTLQLEDNICSAYINDEIAMTTRMYNHSKGYLGFYVTQGGVRISELNCKKPR